MSVERPAHSSPIQRPAQVVDARHFTRCRAARVFLATCSNGGSRSSWQRTLRIRKQCIYVSRLQSTDKKIANFESIGRKILRFSWVVSR